MKRKCSVYFKIRKFQILEDFSPIKTNSTLSLKDFPESTPKYKDPNLLEINAV